MLWLRIGVGLALGYLVLLLLAWLFQERLAFPAPRAPVPHPKDVGIDGERIELVTSSGTKLVGWFLPPRPADSGPSVLWFYGNGENIGTIWPVVREFQPPGIAVLVVDYPGYGASGGRTTERGIYEAADAAYAYLLNRPDVARDRIFVYGRSLGTVAAIYTAATHPTAGLVLESPFTSAREMSRQHYGLFPRFILRLELDNLARIAQVHCPVLVFHGAEDVLVPPDMGRR
ncbi:MAG: alpha/beta hydrolase, partial [Gemmatimonadales bacterium]